MAQDNSLKTRVRSAAFAFRGYNVTNLGRSAELLQHHAYGPVVAELLRAVSEMCADSIGEKVDLAERIRRQEESTLDSFAQDMAMIAAMELAQIRLLEQFFDIRWTDARMVFGYSLGEVIALVASGVYQLQHILPVPMKLAADCADLARDMTMGILFSRGPAVDLDAVRRLCLEINALGRGVIGISTYLSPNTVLLMGQGDTVDQFEARMGESLPKGVHLRRNKHKWPPLHTPILWERNIPNRAAVMMHSVPGGFKKPHPAILSCVTGKASYNEYNSRELLNRWIDHPQRLWDVVCGTLAAGVETVVNVGPEPNLVPATFRRLSDNVTAQLNRRSLNSLGMRAMSGIVRRRTWLNSIISERAVLLRAPFVQHISLEDWLLAQEVP